MTEELIKEQLSNSFINILASYKGFGLTKDELDYGVDFCLKKYATRTANGKKRTYNTGKYIDIQLKATTENSVSFVNSKLVYKLEVKNYNDLIIRKSDDNYTPLILILFVLPNERDEWVKISDEEISLKKNAYWFYPENESVVSSNTTKKTIKIPEENKLDLDCFNILYNKFYSQNESQ